MTTDPANFFRDMMGQWETMTNQFGAAAMRPSDPAKSGAAVPSATAQVQDAARDAMGKALAVYNMPSREDVSALSDRLVGVEDRLLRIESLLTRLAEDKPPRARASRARTSEAKD